MRLIALFGSSWTGGSGPGKPGNRKLDDLAERIKLGIANKGIHVLHKEDLAFIWGNHELSDMEKRMHVKNFAVLFGFHPLIKDDLESVFFRDSN